jgi:hypothetical protein
MAPSDIWAIGESAKPAVAGAALHGRAEIKARQVRATGLGLVADPEPSTHAAIVGWPDEKDKRKHLAQELAKSAQPHLR